MIYYACREGSKEILKVKVLCLTGYWSNAFKERNVIPTR